MSLALLDAAFAGRERFVSPFLVMGDPTPDLSVELARRAVSAGAGMLEIGFPYGDPIADGPAVQRAALRALRAGASTSAALALLGRIRASCGDVPLNLLVYGNLVHAPGYDRFCGRARDAGASSLLVPDIPFEEAGPLRRACRAAGVGHVALAGPLTPSDRLKRLADGAAFVYLAGFQGVTGVRDTGFEAALDLVRHAAALLDVPVCLGFGLSTASQIASAFDAGARVAVVGSHLARIVERAWDPEDPEARDGLADRFETAVRQLTPHSVQN